MKKTNEKVLMSVVAGMTALQGISSTMMNISATTSHVANINQTMTKSDEFESKLHDAKNIMDEKKIDFDSAKGAYSVASKQLEIVQAAYDARDASVKQNYQVTYDAIMNELQPILNEIESLETQINDSKKNLEEQCALNEKASVDLEQAQKDLDAKKTELAELQNKLASLKDVADLTTALETAKSEQETAKSVLTSAQEKADTANTELTNTIADAEAKKAAVEETSVAYNNAVADVTAKTNIVAEKQAAVDQFEDENGIENARAELEITQADYDVNQKEIEAKNNEILALNTQIVNAQSEVDKAQADYEKALNDYNSTSSPLEQAKKNLADFESKYATELSRLTAGSKGYYESLGCYDVLKEIFNVNNDSSSRGELASYTHMGKTGDATSLENMQASIAYLKEYDMLRKQNGLSTPKVSMVAMAIAQVNANYAQVEGNHSGVYGYSENLAWGYGEAGTGASPFRGWYDYEKKQYEAGNHKFSEVGHYSNIVNPDDETTGFALQKVNGVYAQEFGYFEEKDIVMSIDEFETSFNDYYNNLKSVDTQHKALKDAVNNASGTTTKDDTALKNAEALLNAKKNALNGLQNKLTQVNNAKATLEANATVMNNTVTEAKNAVQNAENTVNQKKANVANAEQALSEAKSGVETKEDAKAEAEKKLADAKADVNSIQVRIDTLSDNIANWDSNKAKASKVLKVAQGDLEKAKEVEVKTKEALEKANVDFTKAESIRDEAQVKADQACEELEKATADFKTKSETVVQAQKAVDDYNTNAEAVKKAQAEMKIIGNQIDELKVCKESTNEKIDSLKAQIEVLNKSLTEKKSDALPFEQFKTVLNDVMNQGSSVDLSFVEEKKLHTLLAQLANTVDERNVVQKSLEEAKNNYIEKYNLYLDAKEALLKAESDYNEVLGQLNAFLFEQNKETIPAKKEEAKTDSVNTGVSTNVEASVTTAGLALAGIVLTETKRRKK